MATARYEEILVRIPHAIDLLHKTFSVESLSRESLKLGDVPQMYSLIPLAQTRAAPIGELASSDGIVGSHYKMIENYEVRIRQIADNFARNIRLVGA